MSTKAIAEPEKELRFTRSSQAQLFFLIAVFCVAITVCSLFYSYINWGASDYTLKTYFWVYLLPLIPAAILIKIAMHCVRYAYIILSPLGIEIFPFVKPEDNLQVIYWSQIDHVEFDYDIMTLHFDAEESSGVVVSLAPIQKKQWKLLEHAVHARIKEIKGE